MNFEWIVADFLKAMFIITCPVTLLVGIFLLYDFTTYQKIEKFLSRSYGNTNYVVKSLERNRESLQMFLLKKRQLVGVLCLLNFLIAIYLVVYIYRKY
jgi:hypothetical protein